MSGRFGAVVGGTCIGVGLVSWAIVSGAPIAQGAVVRLTGIRLDDVQDSITRLLLNSGLVPSLPSAIELDVLKAVKAMLQDAGSQIQAEVQGLGARHPGGQRYQQQVVSSVRLQAHWKVGGMSKAALTKLWSFFALTTLTLAFPCAFLRLFMPPPNPSWRRIARYRRSRSDEVPG